MIGLSNERFTLNRDSIDRLYQITDNETEEFYDVYKLLPAEKLCDLLNELYTEKKFWEMEYKNIFNNYKNLVTALKDNYDDIVLDSSEEYNE